MSANFIKNAMIGISSLTALEMEQTNLFPMRAKTFLSYPPKTHVVANENIVPKPRYHLQKVSLSFSETSVSVV